jgi:hypothetical protein
MATVQHQVFGTVQFDPEDAENEWSCEIPWRDATIDVSLFFDGAAMDGATLDRLARYVVDVAEFDRDARAAMRADAADGESAVRLYLEHHLDDPDLIRPALGITGDGPVGAAAGDAVGVEAFVDALRLCVVGLHCGATISEHEATFDYSIDPDATQYVLAVTFDAQGRACAVDMES